MNQHFDKRRERLNLFQAIFSKPKTIKISEKELDFVVCPKCNKAIETNEIKKHLSVCPQCDYHFPLSAYQRVETVFDPSSFYEVYANATSTGLNSFPDYLNKLTRYQKDTNLNEAVVVGTAKVNDIKVAVAIMDSRFMMGSMGQIVGEKITRIIELATRRKYPLIIFTASGGARMQEGIISLMQMAKTSAALERFNQAGGFYLTVLTHPTTGGVSASFAMLGDIILAEPQALIGFAGRRVIEKTVKEQLPDDFQTSEFLHKKGFVDQIVHRKDLRVKIAQCLMFHQENKV
ncbi:MAG TPA: acetyl-CoA carboxylase, carboxyltransferase subunit beta [Erysipelotrichaceae bacterium]|nr:acetyl-CoA carboxylase, carboxyltransferase subunit beta [Erysipelotrichaceae bacterium]